jgi:hypothetical protein
MLFKKEFLFSLFSLQSTVKADYNPLLNESFILLGNFNAISLYDSSSNLLNLSSSSSSSSSSLNNLYELSTLNNSINLLENLNLSSQPTLWHPLNNDDSVILVENEPFILNLKDFSLSKLQNWNNVDGKIESLYFDNDNNIIYFGGSLSFNKTYGAIQYDYIEEQLLSLPFGGFEQNSTINSILKYNDSNSIIFGGSFNSIGYPELLNITYNETIFNYTLIKNTTGIIDISQKIPIKSDQVSATAGDNYKNIICPTNDQNGWKLPNNQIGSWSASIGRDVVPSKIRLYNSMSNTNGVKSFRVITYPANGIMNMTYIDPNDLQIKFCDAYCPLFLSSTIDSSFKKNDIQDNQYYTFTNNNQTVLQLTNSFQDFSFVNSIDVNSFTIEILDYYGNYAELLGIELSSIGITSYAENSLNQLDSCTSINQYDIEVNSVAIGNINWQDSSFGNYLFADVPKNQISNDQGIRYEINIPVSGQYSILMYTPGCLIDNSCNNRGIVNVTVSSSDGEQFSDSVIFQTNQNEKYDVLYTGDLKLIPDSPIIIEMTLLESLNNENIYVVAESVHLQYIQLELNEITGNITNEYNLEKYKMVELNGLFEYSFSNFSNNSIEFPIGNTSVNLIGSLLDPDAIVNTMIINETSLIIAGDFTSNYSDNILGSNIKTLNNLKDQIWVTDFFSIDGGTNGEVSHIYGPNEEFLMLGSFDAFNNISSTKSSSIDGSVLFNSGLNTIENVNITDLNQISQLSGFVFNETEYIVINYNNSNASAELYDFTSNIMFENSSTFAMNIVSSLDTSDNNWMIGSESESSYVIGSIVKFDLASNNIVKIDDNSLAPVENENDNEFISGIFIDNDTFAIAGSNIFLLSANSTSLLSSDLSFNANTQIDSMMYYKSNLIFSIDDNAQFKSKSINGLAFYDMNSHSLKTLNDSFNGSIVDLAVDPQFGNIIGVGSFSVGNCKSICTFGNNTENIIINKSVSDVNGLISSVNYYNEYKALIGGNFTTSGSNGYFGVYDTKNNSITILENYSSELDGPVKNFIFGDERKNNKTLNDIIIVMGDNYIGYFNNSNWNSLSKGLSLQNAQFTDVSLIESTSLDSFYNAQVLLLTGSFTISDYGMVSSAIWNGKQWIPYTITANNLQVNKAKAQSVIRTTSMFVYQGSFTQTSTSSSVPSSSATNGAIHQKTTSEFTNGEVAGVGCALAVGTLMLLTCLGFLYGAFAGSKAEKLEGLKLTGEDRMYHGQQIIEPSSLTNDANPTLNA